jgi:hypothetical protein
MSADPTHYPTVPEKTFPAGRTLPYRLSPHISTGCIVIGLGLLSLFWNGVLSIFVLHAIDTHMQHKPEWILTIILIPFVVIGLLLIFGFVRQVLIAMGVGATTVEISHSSIPLGGAAQVWLSQEGNLRVNALRVLLVCEEEVRYQQGTSNRTETRRVHQSEVFCHEGFDIQRGLPYETKFDVRIPEGVMHSFETSHNKILWKLQIRGDISGWPDFQRDYPIVVAPTPRKRK